MVTEVYMTIQLSFMLFSTQLIDETYYEDDNTHTADNIGDGIKHPLTDIYNSSILEFLFAHSSAKCIWLKLGLKNVLDVLGL